MRRALPLLRPLVLTGLLLVIASGAATMPATSASGFENEVLLASNSSWEKFKRIRQGEDTVAEPVPTETPDANKPAPEAPRQAPAPAVARPPPRAAPVAPPPRSPDSAPTDTQVSAARAPSAQGSWWEFYAGGLEVGNSGYADDSQARNAGWAYAISKPLPRTARVVVSLLDAGRTLKAMQVFAPSVLGDIELRHQAAAAPGEHRHAAWFPTADGEPHAGRRIAATLRYLQRRYQMDFSERGIVLEGEGTGGTGALVQSLILPDPWRESVAYVTVRGGTALPRLGAGANSAPYPGLPPDTQGNAEWWDSIDFSVQFVSDPVARAVHYRQMFSSDQNPGFGVPANAGLRWVNLLERHAIGGAFSWVKGGDGLYERGVRIPDLSRFESPEQDVSLNRPHPAITRSTGNYPRTARERLDAQRFPRGHYNMGVTWNLAGIVDTARELVFPLKYQRRTGLGKGVPDQPAQITVSVTPRRARSFQLEEGEILQWSWDEGAQSGTAVAEGDSVTIDGIPLVSGEGYRLLRLYR